MQEVFAAGFEPGGAVGHDSLALGGTDLAAEIRFAGFTEFAFAAFGGAERKQGSKLGRWRRTEDGVLERYDVVARFDCCDVFADGFDDASALMAENDWEGAFGIFA